MSKYRLYFNTTASVGVTVEADDLESAIELGYNKLPGGICAQCSGWGMEWSRDVGDELEFDESYHQIDGVDVESKPAGGVK